MAVLFPHWRQLCLATVLLAAVTGIPTVITLSESLRWLVLNNRIQRAHKILRNVSPSRRKLSLDDDTFLHTIYHRHTLADGEKQKSSTVRQVLRLLAERRLRVRTLMLAAIWIILAFVFFGITLYGTGALPNTNPMLIIAAMSLARALTHPFYVILFDLFGCRNTLRNFSPLVAVLLLALGFIPRHLSYGAVIYAAIYIAAFVACDLCVAALYIVTLVRKKKSIFFRSKKILFTLFCFCEKKPVANFIRPF